MNKNGVLFTKKELNKMITEARINEMNWREEQFAISFKKALLKLAKQDKELSLYSQAKGIANDSDDFLYLASSLYTVASGFQYNTLRIMSEINDEFTSTCCNEMLDVVEHKQQYMAAANLMDTYAYGNKFIACNIWKLLTNNGYEKLNDKMVEKIKNNNFFKGDMPIIGENLCKYSFWALLWDLTEGSGPGQLNEKKNFANRGKKQRANPNNLAGGNAKKKLKTMRKNVGSKNNNQIQTQQPEYSNQEQNTPSDSILFQPDFSALDQNQNSSNTSNGIKLITDDDVADIMNRCHELDELTKEYEETVNFNNKKQNINKQKFMRGYNRRASQNGAVNEDNQQQPQQQNGTNSAEAEYDRIFNRIKELWAESVNKYIPFFGAFAKERLFTFPDDFIDDIKKIEIEGDLNDESKQWDSEILQDEDELADAIEQMKRKYGLKSNFNWLEWLIKLGNGIANGMNRR